MEGLENVESTSFNFGIDLIIRSNPSLINLGPISKASSPIDAISIRDNASLESLDGFEQMIDVESIEILDNPNLVDNRCFTEC